MYTLYGDGIHDDYPAIQEMIDCGLCEVTLPQPKKKYLISNTLILPSNFKLILPRYANIQLMPNSNCIMLQNKWREKDNYVYTQEGRSKLQNYANRISADESDRCSNIEIIGGIWDFNNTNQMPNPLKSLDFGPTDSYTGFGFQFFNVENLKISSLTLKNPVTYGIDICITSHFLIEDVTFAYDKGNPLTVNMDGIHLDGNCHFGTIRNLHGATFDDCVALNAHEGVCGPITNILIDGIFAQKCHSAVRLLAAAEKLQNIHITNVFGSYYQYCIILEKYYDVPVTEHVGGIVIDNIFAEKAPRTEDVFPYKNSYVFPLITIRDSIADNIIISNVFRTEHTIATPTVYVGENALIKSLSLYNVSQINNLEEKFPVIHNEGTIEKLTLLNISSNGDSILTNEGDIRFQEVLTKDVTN